MAEPTRSLADFGLRIRMDRMTGPARLRCIDPLVFVVLAYAEILGRRGAMSGCGLGRIRLIGGSVLDFGQVGCRG